MWIGRREGGDEGIGDDLDDSKDDWTRFIHDGDFVILSLISV